MTGLILPRRTRGRPTEAATTAYLLQRERFCETILEINSRLDFAVSSRGWGYILEGKRMIDKGDLDIAQRLVNDCRKDGSLPLDICSEDAKRATDGIEQLDSSDPEDEYRWLEDHLRQYHKFYSPVDFWEDLDFYVEVATEKSDLKSLFAKVCDEVHIPITNLGGWSDLHARAAIMRRFKAREAEGKTPLLLYCGDHDPGGLHISDLIHTNFKELEGAVGWSSRNMVVHRFGLEYDFIEKHGLTWIDNLETSNGKYPLDDPRHHDHDKPYVQSYLKKFGARKVEANALVAQPEVGRALCRDTIVKWVFPTDDAVRRYKERLAAKQDALKEIIEGRLLRGAL
jgi:hypothetical protein